MSSCIFTTKEDIIEKSAKIVCNEISSIMNKNYSKEIFIYERENSLTNELCADIIDIFDILALREKICFSNNRESYYNIMDDTSFKRISTYLTFELFNNIDFYKNKIKDSTLIHDNNNKRYVILPSCTKFHLFVKKYSFNENFNHINNIEINQKVLLPFFNVKTLYFIWFLNDYCGKMVFWNKYNILPKVGKIVIFPASWVFSYEDIVKLNNNKYIISGYFY